MAIREKADRLHRPAIWSPERDEDSTVGPATKFLEIVPRDKTAHGVCDYDDARVGESRFPAPAIQAILDEVPELASRGTVIPAPVVRELEIVGYALVACAGRPGLDVECFLNHLSKTRVSVD